MIYISFIISITRLVFDIGNALAEKNKKRNSILFCLCVMYVINKKKSVYAFACVCLVYLDIPCSVINLPPIFFWTAPLLPFAGAINTLPSLSDTKHLIYTPLKKT